MVEQSVEQRGHGGGVTEELAPVVDGTIRGEDRGGVFVAPHDQFEQIFGGGRSFRMPRSSMISSGAVLSVVKTSLRVPSSVASVSSSSSRCASR